MLSGGALTEPSRRFRAALRAWPSLVLAASVACSAPGPGSAGGMEPVRAVLRESVGRGDIPGAVVLVAHRGKVLLREGFGWMDIERRRPMRTDAIFRIASMTKPITSVAVLMLSDAGRVRLEDPVAAFIPEFDRAAVLVPDGTVPAQNAMTVQHLLTHTSGIGYRFTGPEPLATLYARAGISDGLVQTEGTIGEHVRRLATLPLLHEPGTAWEYGLSTDVLGYLVEAISGLSLVEFFAQRIFGPLGMVDTHFFLPDGKLHRLPFVYGPGLDGVGLRRLGEAPIQSGHTIFSTSYHYRGPRTYFSGGAGLVSTVDDYYRFCQMLLNGGTLNGVRLLSRETVDLMTTNRVGTMNVGGHGFGLGVLVHTHIDDSRPGSVGTYGWGGFFYTRFWIDPEEELVGIFMAQRRPDDAVVDRAFRRSVYRAIRRSPGGGSGR